MKYNVTFPATYLCPYRLVSLPTTCKPERKYQFCRVFEKVPRVATTPASWSHDVVTVGAPDRPIVDYSTLCELVKILADDAAVQGANKQEFVDFLKDVLMEQIMRPSVFEHAVARPDMNLCIRVSNSIANAEPECGAWKCKYAPRKVRKNNRQRGCNKCITANCPGRFHDGCFNNRVRLCKCCLVLTP